MRKCVDGASTHHTRTFTLYAPLDLSLSSSYSTWTPHSLNATKFHWTLRKKKVRVRERQVRKLRIRRLTHLVLLNVRTHFNASLCRYYGSFFLIIPTFTNNSHSPLPTCAYLMTSKKSSFSSLILYSPIYFSLCFPLEFLPWFPLGLSLSLPHQLLQPFIEPTFKTSNSIHRLLL